jgi:hypothetical protein
VLRRNLLPRDAVRRVARKPIAWVVVGVLAVGLAFGLYWFAPWKLFTSKTVNEQLADPVPAATQEAPSTSRQPPAGPVLLRQGQFISMNTAPAAQFGWCSWPMAGGSLS